MNLTPITFLVSVTAFFMFIAQIGAMMGTDIIATGTLTLPTTSPNSLPNAITWFFENIFIFFQLMTISTEFALFGALVLTPIAIGIVWVILDLLPFT